MPLAHRLKNHSWSRAEPKNPNARRGVVIYNPGDTIYDVTPAELKEHGKDLEMVNVVDATTLAPSEPEDGIDDTNTDADWDWTEVLSGSVSRVKQYVADLTDAAMVASLQSAEQKSESPRKGVLTACEDRLLQLSTANQDGE